MTLMTIISGAVGLFLKLVPNVLPFAVSGGLENTDFRLTTKFNKMQETSNLPQNPSLQQTAVICSACGAENSIRWEKKSIGIDDKQGSYKDLTFDFCEECGDVKNVDLS